MLHEIKAPKGDLVARINDGKLVSLQRGKIEYFHGAEKPEEFKDSSDKKDWGNSEIIMFPVVGPVAGFKISEPGQPILPMDKHGISRYLPFKEVGVERNYAHFTQGEGSPFNALLNPRHEKDRNSPAYLRWPFKFMLHKDFQFVEDGLNVGFSLINSSLDEMRYHFGWHPGFRALGDPKSGVFHVGEKNYSLEEVAKVDGAMVFEGITSVSYENQDNGREIVVEGNSGFNHVMLWCPSPSSGMFCIEPITQVRVKGKDQVYFKREPFESLKSGESQNYAVRIRAY